MTDPGVADLVEQAQQLADAATAGPWIVDSEGGVDRDGEGWYHVMVNFADPIETDAGLMLGDHENADADAAFIAWCRSGVPALAALVVQLQAEVAEIEQQRTRELLFYNQNQARVERRRQEYEDQTVLADAALNLVRELRNKWQSLCDSLDGNPKASIASVVWQLDQVLPTPSELPTGLGVGSSGAATPASPERPVYNVDFGFMSLPPAVGLGLDVTPDPPGEPAEVEAERDRLRADNEQLRTVDEQVRLPGIKKLHVEIRELRADNTALRTEKDHQAGHARDRARLLIDVAKQRDELLIKQKDGLTALADALRPLTEHVTQVTARAVAAEAALAAREEMIAARVAEEIRVEMAKDYTEGSELVEVLSDYDKGLADAENAIAIVRDRYRAVVGGDETG